MKPIDFKHSNTQYAKDQPEYNTLPALKLETDYGEVITCWKLSFWERVKLLVTGRLWLTMMSFNKPLTPSFMSTTRTDHFLTTEDLKKPTRLSSWLQLTLWKVGIAWHNTKTDECTPDFNCCTKVGRRCWWRLSSKNPVGMQIGVAFSWVIAGLLGALFVISCLLVCVVILFTKPFLK